mgnify:FL=1
MLFPDVACVGPAKFDVFRLWYIQLRGNNSKPLNALFTDRCMFLWRLDTSDLSEAPKIFAEDGDDEKAENRENWTVVKQFR